MIGVAYDLHLMKIKDVETFLVNFLSFNPRRDYDVKTSCRVFEIHVDLFFGLSIQRPCLMRLKL